MKSHEPIGALSRILVVGTIALVLCRGSSAEAADTTPPPTALLPRIASVTASAVTLNWTPGYLTEPTKWRVYQDEVLVKTTSSSSYTASNLVPGTTHAYFIVSVDNAGNASPPTRTMTVTTRGPGVMPGAPSELQVTELASGRIDLAWNEPDDNFDVSSYQVFEGATQVAVAYPTWVDEGTAVIRNLTPGETHSYTVLAMRSAPSEESNTITVTTPPTDDAQPPSAPTDVTVTTSRYSCNFVDIAWDQSADDLDPQPALEYEIIVDGAVYDVIRGTDLYRNAFGGGPGETRTYVVRAVDSAGNASSPSQTVTFHIDSFCTEF